MKAPVIFLLFWCFSGSTAFSSIGSASARNVRLGRKTVGGFPTSLGRHDVMAHLRHMSSSCLAPQSMQETVFNRVNRWWRPRGSLKSLENWMQQWKATFTAGSWRKRLNSMRRQAVALLLSFLLLVGGGSEAWAVTGGRAGGTFKSSQRPNVSRSFSSPHYGGIGRMRATPMPRVIYTSPPSMGLSYSYASPGSNAVVAPVMSTRDVLLLGSVAGLITYGMINGRRIDKLTMGATSTAVLLALNVPDRYDRDSIVNRINDIAKRTDTSTRSGVQTLISEVCLELVRQQASIQAAWSDSNHYMTVNAALKDFQGLSIESRSRYEEETMSNFKGLGYDAEAGSTKTIADGKATMAVISIHFVTEGEDISHFKNMRADVVNLLRWMAATVPVTSLLAGEVLWSPQRTYDTLSKKDIDERYPELTPLI